MLYGDPDHEPKEAQREKLTQKLLSSNLLLTLIQKISTFDFEGKKDAAAIVNFVVRRSHENGAEPHLIKNLDPILGRLLRAYSDDGDGTALPCGSILQEMAKKETLCTHMLKSSDLMYQVMKYVDQRNFDVASDAFTSLKILTTKHKDLMKGYFLE